MGLKLTQALPLARAPEQEILAQLGAVLQDVEEEEEEEEVLPQSLWQVELVEKELEVQQVLQEEREEARGRSVQRGEALAAWGEEE